MRYIFVLSNTRVYYWHCPHNMHPSGVRLSVCPILAQQHAAAAARHAAANAGSATLSADVLSRTQICYYYLFKILHITRFAGHFPLHVFPKGHRQYLARAL